MQEGLPNIAILGLFKAIPRKQCKIGGKLVLIINRKSYMSFWLVPKPVTLNDLERHNALYFALFHPIRVGCRRKTIIWPIPRFQNLLLIVCDHIIWSVRLFSKYLGKTRGGNSLHFRL